MDYHWRHALQDALRRNRGDAHHRYFQLATIDEAGWPANRSVVFRGFSDDGQRLQVATDARSDKVAQLAAAGRGEICWYFTRSREQFRIRGFIDVHDAAAPEAAARSGLWSSMSAAARAQFFWPAPGRPLGEGEPVAEEELPPPSFLLLELDPQRVDHLQLGPGPQRRRSSTLQQGAWHAWAVNP